MKLKHTFLLGLICVACSRNQREVIVTANHSIEEIDTELNGRVKYIYELTSEGESMYDRKGRRTKIVAKDQYFDDDFEGRKIYMIQDSLNVGDTFQGFIITSEKKVGVRILGPVSMDTVTTDHALQITFDCTQKGIFSFKGELEYDTKFPFEYRFVVN